MCFCPWSKVGGVLEVSVFPYFGHYDFRFGYRSGGICGCFYIGQAGHFFQFHFLAGNFSPDVFPLGADDGRVVCFYAAYPYVAAFVRVGLFLMVEEIQRNGCEQQEYGCGGCRFA